MFYVSPLISIPDKELEFSAIRAQGAGGQHVNKVSSAVHLRFDIAASSLPAEYKAQLLALADHRISKTGVLVIKSQQHRRQEQNKLAALQRLQALLETVSATLAQVPRRPSRPSRLAKRKRLTEKIQHGQIKALRGRVRKED